MLHLRNYTAHVIVLNSERAIRDLFARRGALYADRPQTAMYCADELVGRGRTVFSTSYGARFRRYSKMLHGALGAGAIDQYRGAQDDATDKMLADMLRNPDAFVQNVRT